jgi:hypothetical protein
MTMYEILCVADALHKKILADYPNAAEDDEIGYALDHDPRFEEWHKLMSQAEKMLPFGNDPENVLCEFDSSMSEADLKQRVFEVYYPG